MAGRLRHFQRIIGEANKRGFGILSTRKNLRSGSRPKTEILRECSHTPYACFSITTPERKGGEGTDVTKFEIVWLKAQSLRRIESSNATNSLKLTDRMEGFFGPKEKLINNTTIPQHQIEAIARCLLPDILAFYESEEGQREFAEWKKQGKAESQEIKAK